MIEFKVESGNLTLRTIDDPFILAEIVLKRDNPISADLPAGSKTVFTRIGWMEQNGEDGFKVCVQYDEISKEEFDSINQVIVNKLVDTLGFLLQTFLLRDGEELVWGETRKDSKEDIRREEDEDTDETTG